MAKFVCDYEQVTSIGEKMCQAATDVSTSVSSYSSSIESDLSTWTGVAKESYQATNSDQAQLAMKDADYINSLGEFIKDASSQIQKLDDELAGLSI